MRENKFAKKIAEWAVSGDTGLSSESILAFMMGIKPAHGFDAPLDADDRGRCIRLLNRFPEWWERLDEMASLPSYKVTCWNKNGMEVREEGWKEQIPLIKKEALLQKDGGK